MKPAIFNTAMVRAILDGRKTQTRRELKVPSDTVFSYKTEWKNTYTFSKQEGTATKSFTVKAPYIVGDIIYVRETFIHGVKHDENDRPLTTEDGSDWIWETYYRADDEYLNWVDADGDPINTPWKPSIHMPKEYARLFLRVKDVRIERLNEINSADAKAEGIDEKNITDAEVAHYMGYTCDAYVGYYDHEYTISAFAKLWESIYGDGSFDNRYVWVIEFEQISKEEGMS